MQIMTALQLSGNPRGVEFDDLYQTGYLAMVAAVETYSPERGAFSTWFMFHLKTAFSEATGYRTKSGRCEPLNTAASLDRPVQPDEPDGGTLGELVPDSRAADAIENVEESVYHEQLHKAIDGAISEAGITLAVLGRYDAICCRGGHGQKPGANAADGKQGNPGTAQVQNPASLS